MTSGFGISDFKTDLYTDLKLFFSPLAKEDSK